MTYTATVLHTFGRELLELQALCTHNTSIVSSQTAQEKSWINELQCHN